MIDRIVLVGAGKTSGSIADRLAQIAPLTVIDTSAAALELMSTRSLDASAAGETHPILRRVGDGTSRLVLCDLRGSPKSTVALVVAPGDDRAALECCRLAVEIEYRPVVAIVNDRDVAQQCEALGARALVRAEIVGHLVEQSLQQAGLGINSAVGFNRGELLEFRVLPSSPAIGVPLSNLRADGWRVAAIYRGSVLVLPTGSTSIQADDRVLVVGDPRQLSHVAESLRVGLPTFPLLHGPNVVVYLPLGRDDSVEQEAEVIARRTRAARLVRLFPGASGARTSIETPLPSGANQLKHFDVAPLDGPGLDSHLPSLRAKKPGVVVAKANARKAVDVMLGRGGAEARLCNELGVPVLFPKGDSEYRRVVLCVSDGDGDLGAAEIALDLARMFEVPLRIQHVRLPAYLQAADGETDKLVETIIHRSRLHGLKPERDFVEGNPLVQWLRATRPSDLAVLARRASLRDSFSRPDLALRLARQATCSVLVVTSPS